MIYFNENDAYPAQWLRNLFPGAVVDERSVKDVRPSDAIEYQRAHFFAGIGGWEYALHLAGWPSDRQVWTGSCPCQPFSQAGKRKGTADDRHLWPEFLRLISECRPATILGEQVASPDGRKWLAGIFADLEALGYAVAGADLCAASVGAPHKRQRLYWVADAGGERRQQVSSGAFENERTNGRQPNKDNELASFSQARRLPDADGIESENRSIQRGGAKLQPNKNPSDFSSGLVNANSAWPRVIKEATRWPESSNASLIYCGYDQKYRRFEPSIMPLADGLPARMGRLRAYGNAIVPQVAASFIRSFLETET